MHQFKKIVMINYNFNNLREKLYEHAFKSQEAFKIFYFKLNGIKIQTTMT